MLGDLGGLHCTVDFYGFLAPEDDIWGLGGRPAVCSRVCGSMAGLAGLAGLAAKISISQKCGTGWCEQVG